MIKIQGNEIWRGDKKIGWLEEHHIRDNNDRKLGYFDDKYIYNEDAHKLAYIEGDFLIPYNAPHADESKIRLEKVAEDCVGGVVSEIARAAIYILLGS